MTQKLSIKKVLLSEIEAVYGTDPGLLAANAMMVTNVSAKPMASTREKRQRAYPAFGADLDQIAQKYRTLQFDIEAAGSGVAGTVPLYDCLMQACGLSSTVVAETSVTYAPISTGQKSATEYYFLDGLKHTLLGSRGNVKLTLDGGKLPQWTFSMSGLYADWTDTAVPAGIGAQLENFINGVEVNDANTTLTLGGIAVVADKFELDIGNTVIFRDRPNASYIALTDRKASGSITFELNTVATKDWMAGVASETTYALALTHGTVAGNIISVSAAKVQLGEPTYTDLQGVAGVTFPLSFVRTVGDDEFSIVLT